MRKKLLLTTMFLTIVGMVSSQNTLVVNDFTLPQSGGNITVTINLDETSSYNAYGFEVVTPAGFSYAVNSEDLVPCETDGHTGNMAAHFDDSERVLKVQFMQPSRFENQTLSIRIPLEATAENVGTTHEFTIKQIFFITTSFTKVSLNDVVKFNVTIGEPADPRTLLDENSTTVPAAATGVDVRVRRTINADVWSTICLPFAMSEAQVKAAFGDDVQLADFTGTEPEFDNDDKCVAVKANFAAVTAIEANHPYIIKVSQPITEFTVDGVDIVADEAEAYIEFDNGKTGSRKEVYSGFYGTYHAGTVLDEFTLFLNDNKFWYSTGQTKMKAFRAYFEFLDILSEVEDASMNVKMAIEGESTRIDGLLLETSNDAIYDLTGRKVEKAEKGIYIVNGKKVLK